MESMPWILDSQVPRPSCELGYLTRPWMNIWEWGRSRYSSGEISTNNILAFQPDACMLCHQHPSFPNSSTCLGHYCAIYLYKLSFSRGVLLLHLLSVQRKKTKIKYAPYLHPCLPSPYQVLVAFKCTSRNITHSTTAKSTNQSQTRWVTKFRLWLSTLAQTRARPVLLVTMLQGSS